MSSDPFEKSSQLQDDAETQKSRTQSVVFFGIVGVNVLGWLLILTIMSGPFPVLLPYLAILDRALIAGPPVSFASLLCVAAYGAFEGFRAGTLFLLISNMLLTGLLSLILFVALQ